MKKSRKLFQNVVIALVVGWLSLFVFLPNLMIIGTSFLTRDDASLVQMVFTGATTPGCSIRCMPRCCCTRSTWR